MAGLASQRLTSLDSFCLSEQKLNKQEEKLTYYLSVMLMIDISIGQKPIGQRVADYCQFPINRLAPRGFPLTSII